MWHDLLSSTHVDDVGFLSSTHVEEILFDADKMPTHVEQNWEEHAPLTWSRQYWPDMRQCMEAKGETYIHSRGCPMHHGHATDVAELFTESTDLTTPCN
jgi:hypothetical protein